MTESADEENSKIRAIAFFLPQFHPIPENDAWWGKGFTEWRNVTKARPLFPGHYQPHLPADLGFYDLRLPEVREAQAELAKQYGISGFCYYHYWFNGRRVLEKPVDDIVSSGKPDFPFCVCWANENWSRAWDGGERDILLDQRYSDEDDKGHIESLIPILRDSRYIRINGKPLLLIYRTELLPDPARTAQIWRDAAVKAGLAGIFLARVENFVGGIDPREIGFDASVEFSPDNREVGEAVFSGPLTRRLSKAGILPKVFSEHTVLRYRTILESRMRRPIPDYKRFRCVTPMWDNTPRRKTNGRILLESSPELYQQWLLHVCKQTLSTFAGDERIVFINAWNEWAEGCHLEPDLKYGHAYLLATRKALETCEEELPRINSQPDLDNRNDTRIDPSQSVSKLKQVYWELLKKLGYFIKVMKVVLRIPTSL